MSVIVWDGKTLAADRMCTNGNLRRLSTKIWRTGDVLIGGAGTAAAIQMLKAWVEGGLSAEDFPKLPDSINDVCLWVINKSGTMAKFEGDCHFPVTYLDETWADGSGRDFAYGAMAMGADAVRAVEIACRYDAYCGGGVDTLTFD